MPRLFNIYKSNTDHRTPQKPNPNLTIRRTVSFGDTYGNHIEKLRIIGLFVAKLLIETILALTKLGSLEN